MIFSGLISIVCFACAGLLVASITGAYAGETGIVQKAITGIVAFVSMILISGYCLSGVSILDNIDAWAGCALVWLVVALVCSWALKITFRQSMAQDYQQSLVAIGKFVLAFRKRDFLTRVCAAFLLAASMIAVVQLFIACLLTPAHHDSLSFILPRMAHYIQQGNLDHYNSNCLAETVHFKNVSVLQIFFYLSTDRNENLVQLVSLMCSFLATLSIYGIASVLWRNNTAALFAATVFSLLTNNLMLSVTPQMDMPITGFVAATVYCLLGYAKTRKHIWIGLSAITAAIAFGMKGSALLLVPSLGIVALGVFWHVYKAHGLSAVRSGLATAAVASIVGIAVFMIPSGYADNIQRYGHILGPHDWRNKHVLHDVTLNERLSIGTTNAARYAVHFTGMDGYPAWGRKIQSPMRDGVKSLFALIGLDLLSTDHVRQPFKVVFFWLAHEDISYWGAATFLFVWPAIFFVLAYFRRQPLVIALFVAGICYFAAQSFSSMYDPWRGRSFANLGIFIVPLVACLFLDKNGRARKLDSVFHKSVWVFVSIAMIYGAVNASLFRFSSPCNLFFQPLDRTELLCRCNQKYQSRIERYEELVPPDSTVLLRDVDCVHQYALYGEKLNRTIVFPGEAAAANDGIDFEIFASAYHKPIPGDVKIDLGKPPGQDGRWFLRKLNRTATKPSQSIVR